MARNVSDFYKDYRKQYLKTNLNISQTDYAIVVKAMCENVMNELFAGKDFVLPLNMGTFRIVKYKTNRRYIDWNNTKKYGKYIYFNNLHSDGFSYKFKWVKDDLPNFAGKTVYGFQLGRHISRRLGKGIKQNKLEFLSE